MLWIPILSRRYYMTWGWGDSNDGYYSYGSTYVNPYYNYSFTYERKNIINIKH